MIHYFKTYSSCKSNLLHGIILLSDEEKNTLFIKLPANEVSEEKHECQRHQNWHFKPKFHDFSLIFHYYLQHFEKYRNLMEIYNNNNNNNNRLYFQRVTHDQQIKLYLLAKVNYHKETRQYAAVTHYLLTSLASFLLDIGKCNAAECGVSSGMGIFYLLRGI